MQSQCDAQTPLRIDYASRINRLLKPASQTGYVVLDLFAGCGGLALGFEAVGFRTIGMESDEKCCDSYNTNLQGECIKQFITPETRFPNADVVIGGPPCQPFSVIGHQRGNDDERNGFPAFISAVKRTKPKLWMFENVRGMLYRNKSYFKSSITRLENLGYEVEYKIINMANYGVPQNRTRIVTVGHNGGFEFPTEEKSSVTAGEALRDTVNKFDSESKFLTPSMDKYVAVYEKKSQVITPRDLHLDRPARTVTCRNLAGATSDMHRIKLPDERRRRLTVREGARLQGFPDWFAFAGTETDGFNQVGNAVPPIFARSIATQIKKYLDSDHFGKA